MKWSLSQSSPISSVEHPLVLQLMRRLEICTFLSNQHFCSCVALNTIYGSRNQLVLINVTHSLTWLYELRIKCFSTNNHLCSCNKPYCEACLIKIVDISWDNTMLRDCSTHAYEPFIYDLRVLASSAMIVKFSRIATFYFRMTIQKDRYLIFVNTLVSVTWQ